MEKGMASIFLPSLSFPFSTHEAYLEAFALYRSSTMLRIAAITVVQTITLVMRRLLSPRSGKLMYVIDVVKLSPLGKQGYAVSAGEDDMGICARSRKC